MLACHTRMLTAFILVGLPLIVFGQAQLIRMPSPSEQTSIRQFVAPPHDFVELCTDVKARRAVTWQFEAEHPVGFNTHFHVEGAAVYPESMTAMSAAKGRLVPGGDQDYCWMWTNPMSQPVVIRMQFGP